MGVDQKFTKAATPFGRAGEILRILNETLTWEKTEESRFRVLDVTREAMEICDELRNDDVTIGMIHERIGRVQSAFGWQ